MLLVVAVCFKQTSNTSGRRATPICEAEGITFTLLKTHVARLKIPLHSPADRLPDEVLEPVRHAGLEAPEARVSQSVVDGEAFPNGAQLEHRDDVVVAGVRLVGRH